MENGKCTVSGTADVRYGAQGKYITKTVTGEIACTNQAFGNDPIYGVVKTCDVNTINQITQGNWQTCAIENGICAVDGTATVRYGAEGKYITKIVTGEIVCTNQAFGNDPIFGAVKTCDVLLDWVFCAFENALCSVKGTKRVRYGANGKYNIKTLSGPEIACNNAIFGDPIPTVAKQCFVEGGEVPLIDEGNRFAQTFAAVDREGDGEFSGAYPLGVIPIHAMVLPDGKVLSFGATASFPPDGRYIFSIFDPTTGLEEILPNTERTNIFCSHMSLDPATGYVVIAGGDSVYEAGTQFEERGETDVLLFDYRTRTIRQAPQGDLRYGRYYPNMLNLPNGEILVLGGRDTGFVGATISEVITSDRSIRQLTGAAVPDFSGDDYWYPHAFVNSRGEVIIIEAYNNDIFRMSTTGNGSVQKIGNSGVASFKLQPSLMVRVDTVALLGNDGGIYVANIAMQIPTFNKVASIGTGRINAAMVPLPNGSVAFMGGEAPQAGTGGSLTNAITQVQIWDPETNKVQTLNERNAVPRLYHSSGILLPDATIWTGGGGSPGPIANANVEIYAPSYLYSSGQIVPNRSEIIQAPRNINVGQTFTVQVNDANRTARVTMIRSGAFTHSRNSDARYLSLTYSVENANTLRILVPDNPNVLIRGLWMLFVLDQNNRPSRAALIGVGMANVVDTPQITEQTSSLKYYNIENEPIRGPFRLSVEARFDDLSKKNQKVFDFADDSRSRILLGQIGFNNMEFTVVQNQKTYRVTANGAIVQGEFAKWAVAIDWNGGMQIMKNEKVLVTGSGVIPLNIERRLSFIGESQAIEDDRFVGTIRNLRVENL